MRRSYVALAFLVVVLALCVSLPASASRRRPSAGPFIALRDANGRPLLAWGSDGLVRRAGELGFGAVVLTARSLQHTSLRIPGVRRHLVTGEAGSALVAEMRTPAPGHRSFVNRAFRRIANRWR